MSLAVDAEAVNRLEMWSICGCVSMAVALFDDIREQKIRWFPIVLCIGIGLISKMDVHTLTWKEICMNIAPGTISFLVSKAGDECIGAGDCLLILDIGLLYGFSFCMKMILIACVVIFFFSVIMLLKGKLHRKSQVACVPFLFLGYIGAWLI